MSTEAGLECRRIYFSGRVQGVGFRTACRQHARRLGLQGWVRNLRDGRVEALVQGPPRHIAEFKRRMESEGPWIRVDALVEELESPGELPPGFQILQTP